MADKEDYFSEFGEEEEYVHHLKHGKFNLGLFMKNIAQACGMNQLQFLLTISVILALVVQWVNYQLKTKPEAIERKKRFYGKKD